GVAGAALEGIDLNTVGEVTEIPHRIIDGRLPEHPGEAVLGLTLAQKIGAAVGSDIRVILPFSSAELAGEVANIEEPEPPKIKEVRVVGHVKMGLHDYDKKIVFMTLPGVQSLLNQEGKI